MDQSVNSEVFVKVLIKSEPMNFPLNVSPSIKGMGDRMRQGGKIADLGGSRTHDLQI